MARRNVRIALLCAAAFLACAAVPAFAGSPNPDPVPTGPSPDPAPVTPQPKPKPAPKPVVHTPAPVVHRTPAPVVHVTPRPTPVVVAPSPAPAPVQRVVHHSRHRVVHHRKHVVHHAAKKPVVHKAKPQTAPATDPGNQTELAAAPVKVVRTAAITPPLKAAHVAGSDEGKFLLLAAFALLLVGLASASILRLLVQANKTQQGW